MHLLGTSSGDGKTHQKARGFLSSRTAFLLQVIVGYVVLATLWIFLSDRLLEAIIGADGLARLSTFKGLLFVGVTAVLLFVALLSMPAESGTPRADAPPQAQLAYRIMQALVIPSVAGGLQWLCWDYLSPYAWFFFYPSVFLSIWVGGLAGGLTATVVSVAIGWFVFIPPHFSFAFESISSALSTVGSGVMGLAFSLTLARMRRVERDFGEARFRGLVEQSVVGMYIIQDDTFTYVNPGMANVFGYGDPQEMVGLHPLDLVKPEDRATVAENMRRRASGEILSISYGFTGIRRDGREIQLEVHGRGFVENNRRGVIGVLLDVTDREQASAHVKLAAEVFEQSSEGISVTDAHGNIVMVNRAFTRITGYEADEVVGKNPSLLSSGLHDGDFYREMWAAIEQDGRWRGEIWNRRKDGSIYPENLSISRMSDAQGKTLNYIGIFADITRHKEDEQRIQRLANFDALTGLPNRALLSDLGRHDISIAQRNGGSLAVIYLDLDQFKNINDTLGHFSGDVLLTEVARRLSSVAREQDTVARLGGDEFVLLLPGADADGASRLARRLLDAVVQPYDLGQQELVVTGSVGIAMFPGDAKDFDGLLKCAEIAMYRAKNDGRNCFRSFATEMHDGSARALQLENSLRRALARNQLMLYYQPQFSVDGQRIIGAEALLRWRHPELGMVSPAEFIPIAESSGQILAIGEWVLRTAVRQCKDWIDLGLNPMTIAVNLSAVQFRQPGLPELVTDVLEEAKLPARYLELELTESVAMDRPQEAIAMMDKLHALGVCMSVDDFGTGYSSLSYLKRFKVYKLKIDQGFVRDLVDDPDDRAIVSAIVSLAKSLGMHTIAEGVETPDQLEFLHKEGCDEVQGYLFARPMPAEQFEKFVREHRPTVLQLHPGKSA